MLSMVERHSCQVRFVNHGFKIIRLISLSLHVIYEFQVRTLKQRIASLEQDTKSNVSQPEVSPGHVPHTTRSETTL